MKHIANIYNFLKTTNETEIKTITTLVQGCWYDVEFDAHAAGWNVIRFNDPELIKQHKFSECYLFTKR